MAKKMNPALRALPIPMPRPCPGCTQKERIIRGLADILAGTAGAVVGGAAGGYYGPTQAVVGAEIGQEAAPYLVEEIALALAGQGNIKKKVKRKASAYSKKYAKAFKKLQKKFKKKGQSCWKKGGYARCVRAAHKAAKNMR